MADAYMKGMRMNEMRLNIRRGLIRLWILFSIIWIGLSIWDGVSENNFTIVPENWQSSERYLASVNFAEIKEKEFEARNNYNLDYCDPKKNTITIDIPIIANSCEGRKERIFQFRNDYLDQNKTILEIIAPTEQSGIKWSFRQINWTSVLSILIKIISFPLLAIISYGLLYWVIKGFYQNSNINQK